MIQKLLKSKTTILAISMGVLLILGVALIFFPKAAPGRVLGEVHQGPLVQAVYGIGTIQAHSTWDLRIGVTSSVERFFVEEGDTVSKGDPLALITGVEKFRAPFDGTITHIAFREKETVFPQTAIMTLVDLRDRYLTVSLEQKAMIHIEEGQKARINFESMRDQTFEGTVRNFFSHEDSFLVTIDSEELPGPLLPGMSADVAIIVDQKESVLQVPVEAVEFGQVHVLRNGKVQTVKVKLGTIGLDYAEILEGDLKPGEKIVYPNH